MKSADDPTIDIDEEIAALDELLAEADKSVEMLVLVTGQRQDGRDFWAYAAILPSKYTAFMAAEAQGNYRLNDYGRVLTSGDGLEPPSGLEQQLREKFNLSTEFEAVSQALELQIWRDEKKNREQKH